jgi:hypothetical protein
VDLAVIRQKYRAEVAKKQGLLVLYQALVEEHPPKGKKKEDGKKQKK